MFDQNVTHVHRVNTLVDGVQTPSMVVVLTFSKPIPYSVTMGFRSFVVRAYFSKPMRCINGHRINHTMTRWESPLDAQNAPVVTHLRPIVKVRREELLPQFISQI